MLPWKITSHILIVTKTFKGHIYSRHLSHQKATWVWNAKAIILNVACISSYYWTEGHNSFVVTTAIVCNFVKKKIDLILPDTHR